MINQKNIKESIDLLEPMSKESKLIVYKTKDGKKIQFPFCLIKGKGLRPTICITAGIHGCEYSSIAAAIKFFKELKPEIVSGTIKIITISNLPAFENRTMFVCPVDNKNLNGIFPGKEDGSYSEILVYKLFNEFIKDSDYYIDLHGGDMVENVTPFSFFHKSGNNDIDENSKELAEFYGLPNIMITTSRGIYPDLGYTYACASENGIPALMAEVGGIGKLEDEDIKMHLKGLYNVLKHIGCLDENPNKNEGLIYYNKYVWIKTKTKGIFYSKRKLGDEINKDDELGIVKDYFGNEKEIIKAPFTGKILCLTTSPAMKEKGQIMAIGGI